MIGEIRERTRHLAFGIVRTGGVCLFHRFALYQPHRKHREHYLVWLLLRSPGFHAFITGGLYLLDIGGLLQPGAGGIPDEEALPYAWGGFVLFLMLYVPGFADGVSGKLVVAGVTSAALTYLMALLEKKDPVAIGRLLQWRREGHARKVLEGLPCWVVTLPFVLASAVLLGLVPGDLAAAAGGFGSRALIVAAVAFLVRDVGLLLYLNLAKKPQRADMFMILCLALLYGLFPGVLEMMDAASATAVFWPRDSYWGISLAASVLSAVGAWKLVVIRWRRLIVEA